MAVTIVCSSGSSAVDSSGRVVLYLAVALWWRVCGSGNCDGCLLLKPEWMMMYPYLCQGQLPEDGCCSTQVYSVMEKVPYHSQVKKKCTRVCNFSWAEGHQQGLFTRSYYGPSIMIIHLPRVISQQKGTECYTCVVGLVEMFQISKRIAMSAYGNSEEHSSDMETSADMLARSLVSSSKP